MDEQYTKRQIVFLDRDGTLARDVPYCSRVEDFHLFADVPEGIRDLNVHGFTVVMVTNQSGLARGYFTVTTLEAIHNKMSDELTGFGSRIDAIYVCPHHPDDGCECRKPRPGLLLQALKEFNLKGCGSYIIGDMQTDVQAGKTVGCRTILLSRTLEPPTDCIGYCKPDYIARDLLEATNWIIGRTQNTL